MSIENIRAIKAAAGLPKPKKFKSIAKKSAKRLKQEAEEKKLLKSQGVKPLSFSVGDKYNRLTIIDIVRKNLNGHYVVKCLCDCGNTHELEIQALKSGNTKSCGCLNSENTIKRNTTHGKSHYKEYRHWADMKTRCDNENRESFHRYGGRGIHVCDRWKESFENFLEDMGKMPTPKHTVERIDVNEGYNPTNCKWATIYEQSRNKSNNVFVEYNGETKIMADWAKEFNIPHKTLSERYYKGLRGDELFFSGKYINSGTAILSRWFKERRLEMKGYCAHCSGRINIASERYYLCSIAHILPKRLFKSVATHPKNWIELCFLGNSCHTNFDNHILDITELNCYDLVIERFVAMYPSIAPKERKYIPDVLLQYVKNETDSATK